MAWEQNPYTVKVSLTADTSLNPTLNSAGFPVYSPQFHFVALGTKTTTVSVTATAGNYTITGLTATPAGFAGIVPGALIGATSGIAAGTTVTSINIAAGSMTVYPAPTGNTTAISVTSQGQPSSQPVATAIVAGQTAAGTTAVAAGGTGPKAIGILQNAPSFRTAANGNLEALVEAEITVSGISKVVCGAAVTVGQPLTIDTTGAVLPVTYNGSTNTYAGPTQWVYGTALSSGAAGDLIAMAVAAASPARNA